MGAAMHYSCDGPGCDQVAVESLPAGWQTSERPADVAQLMGAGGQPIEGPLVAAPGYLIYCSAACKARVSIAEAIAEAAGPAEADAWREAQDRAPRLGAPPRPGPAVLCTGSGERVPATQAGDAFTCSCCGDTVTLEQFPDGDHPLSARVPDHPEPQPMRR